MRDAGLLQVAEAAEINTPGDSEQVFLFVDTSDGLLKSKNSLGVVQNATVVGADVRIIA